MGIDHISQTVPARLQEVVSRFEHRPALRWFDGRGWVSLTWAEVNDRVQNLGSGFLAKGLRAGDTFAIMGKNSASWILADLALVSIGVVTVPIYPTLDAATVRAILENSGVRGIVVDADVLNDRDDVIVECITALGRRRTRLVMSDTGGEVELNGWRSLGAVEAAGAEGDDRQAFYRRLQAIQPTDLFTIIYTSGTTGEPKGVMLRHNNVLANIWAGLQRLDPDPGTGVYLAILPFAHSFERYLVYAQMSAGNQINVGRSLDRLVDDLQVIEPTLFITVPRLLEKVHARIIERVETKGWLARGLFRWAVRQGLRAFHRDRETTLSYIARLLVLNKIRQRFGWRLDYIISGGSALSLEILEFFGACGVPVVEGYGLTEASPVIAWSPPADGRPGTVGKVYSNLEARIGPEDELLVRGPSISPGYFKNAAATQRSLDADGWLHTGDQASLTSDGYLTITGRLKDILVLSNGKNVPVQKVENAFKKLSWVDQICLIGDDRPYAVGLLVMDPGLLAKKAGVEHAAVEDLFSDDTVLTFVEAEVERINQTLSSFETLKRVALLPQSFTEAGGTLTPTQKVRRHVIREKYADLVEGLYGGDTLATDGGVPLLPRTCSVDEMQTEADD